MEIAQSAKRHKHGEVLPPQKVVVQLEVKVGGSPALADNDPLWRTAQAAKEFVGESQAPNTRSGYASDWADFERWCLARNLPSMPSTPPVVALYITDLARGFWDGKKRKVSTIARRLAAINAYHKRNGKTLPASQKYAEVSLVLQGIKRKLGTAPKVKLPIDVAMADKMLVDTGKNPVAAKRNRVIILVGLAGAFRRSELIAVQIEHMRQNPDGSWTIRIPRSKTDQTGVGREVEIPRGTKDETCPSLAIRHWLAELGNPEVGPLLREVNRWGYISQAGMHPESIARVIHKLAKAAGFTAADYAGHSLRAGFVTAAAAGGASDREIMRQTGHKSRAMIDRYSRRDQLDRREAAGKVGF